MASETKSANGIAYGIEAGFDVRVLQGLLAGVYAGVEGSTVDDCDELDEDVGDEVCIKAGRNFTAGGRLGIPTGDGGLIYAKVGYSRGRFRATTQTSSSF